MQDAQNFIQNEPQNEEQQQFDEYPMGEDQDVVFDTLSQRSPLAIEERPENMDVNRDVPQNDLIVQNSFNVQNNNNLSTSGGQADILNTGQGDLIFQNPGLVVTNNANLPISPNIANDTDPALELPPSTEFVCNDVEPVQGLSCNNHVLLGVCNRLEDTGYCQKSCDTCCTNTAPNESITCQEVVDKGLCPVVIGEGYCQLACGECTQFDTSTGILSDEIDPSPQPQLQTVVQANDEDQLEFSPSPQSSILDQNETPTNEIQPPVMFEDECGDIQLQGSFSCEEYTNLGFCQDLRDTEFCQKSCGFCCTDFPPNQVISCEIVLARGQCDAFVDSGNCLSTCGACQTLIAVPKTEEDNQQMPDVSSQLNFQPPTPEPEQDRSLIQLLEAVALLGFKGQMSDAQNLSSWKGRNACQNWVGIVCEEGRVVEISLGNIDFYKEAQEDEYLWTQVDNRVVDVQASLSPELSVLEKLTQFEIKGSNLFGSIPNWITLWKGLEVFQANYNNMTGSIPPEMSNLKNMQVFNFRSNNITGSIPEELSIWTMMQIFDLAAFGLMDLSILILIKSGIQGACPGHRDEYVGYCQGRDYLNGVWWILIFIIKLQNIKLERN
eukprot:TRINITY_DN10617_c0_g1_i3.p1 TRINITY_DN10617_c0_g1~~TRINITY_DN10617_c0_g1_i3.p1  ORF type:complete len:707 (-),score=57.94 TRINITY_DN10617_c0_g1_i3:16-1839(-)